MHFYTAVILERISVIFIGVDKHMKTGFSTLHPMVQAMFFVSCISVTMLIMHPVFLIISLISSFIYLVYSYGFRQFLKMLKVDLVTSVIIILVNPLISHGGITFIAYLPSGNPMTLESILFGCAAAMLLSCTFNWFFCVSRVMNSDRIIYLFGKIAPKLALMISMILCFSGKFSGHYREVVTAQQLLYRNSDRNRLFRRLKISVKAVSSMIQWSLENSIDTADSMKSRGYGAGKRTFYHIFRMRTKDVILLVWMLITDILIVSAFYREVIFFSYYPVTQITCENTESYFIYVIYIFLCMLPVIADRKEDIKWKYLRSKI